MKHGRIRLFVAAFVVALSAVGISSGKEYQRLSWDTLAAKLYDPMPPEDRSKKVVRKDKSYLERHVLDSVLALDGKPVEIAGYMLPLSVKGEKVDEFLLMSDTGACCFGEMPVFNGFVYARAKKGANLFDNIPIRIRGKLTVEEVWQSGFFSHLYHVEVEEVLVGFGTTEQSTLLNP